MNQTAHTQDTLTTPAPVRWRLAAPAFIVTVCTAIANAAVFALLLRLGLGASAATITAACMVLVPKFLASRYGVWKSTSGDFNGQAVRFFAVSSVFVGGAAIATEIAAGLGVENTGVVLCNVAFYTLAWVVRFAVMDRYVFRD